MEVSPQVRDLVVDILVVAQMQISWVFSMSSRSLVGVSIGSCAILSENIGELGYVRVAFDAFNVESQFVCSRAELLKPVETPQVQFLAKVYAAHHL